MLRALANRMVEAGIVRDSDLLYQRLVEREELASTAIGHGVAIPHCKMEELDRVVMAIGLARRGVEFESEDGEPVRLFFLIVSPADAPAAHLRSLAAISKWVKTDHHVERLLDLEEPDDIWALVHGEGG